VTARQIFAALAVLVWCALVWWFIQWRTAPPPPPMLEQLAGAARDNAQRR
jgi:hypothetical protein